MAAYAGMVERLFGFYSAVEPRLAEGAGPAAGWLLEERAKTPLLVDDLERLGRSAAEVERLPRVIELPRMDGLPRVLGTLYVLEGATLGGKVIEREVGRRLGLGRHSGTAFFGAYGSDAARRWRGLCAIIEEQTLTCDLEPMLDTAAETFAACGRWLSS